MNEATSRLSEYLIKYFRYSLKLIKLLENIPEKHNLNCSIHEKSIEIYNLVYFVISTGLQIPTIKFNNLVNSPVYLQQSII